MPEIHYKIGDATCPETGGHKIIAHICNDIGGWGKGFVMALSRRWPEPEKAYRKWHSERSLPFELGAVQTIEVAHNLFVANMIAQHGIHGKSEAPPIRYTALRSCLENLSEEARRLDASVHMPRIGCGLAGGKWEKVEPIIKDTLLAARITVHVYDFESSTSG